MFSIVFKYVILFFGTGALWFLLFSIPVSDNSNVFVSLQSEFSSLSIHEKIEKPTRELDREQVIKSLTTAFD